MKNAVFLSASVPDPNRAPEYAQTADSVAIVAAVNALLYVTLGRRPLVWGGHPAITPLVLEMCKSMKIDYGHWVRLYLSQYFEDFFPPEVNKFDNVVIVPRAADGLEATSLYEMRRTMLEENEFAAAVFIGGMKGIVDEWQLFANHQPEARIVPLASTGGASIVVARELGVLSGSLYSDLEYVGLLHEALGISQKERRHPTPEAQSEDLESQQSHPPDAYT